MIQVPYKFAKEFTTDMCNNLKDPEGFEESWIDSPFKLKMFLKDLKEEKF